MIMKYKDFKMMSLNEMKNIKGGTEDEGMNIKYGECTHVVGAWTYIHPVSLGVCIHDGELYCSIIGVNCTGNPGS
jgi:hypothetical protein